jgi:hypothetical protein
MGPEVEAVSSVTHGSLDTAVVLHLKPRSSAQQDPLSASVPQLAMDTRHAVQAAPGRRGMGCSNKKYTLGRGGVMQLMPFY